MASSQVLVAVLVLVSSVTLVNGEDMFREVLTAVADRYMVS